MKKIETHQDNTKSTFIKHRTSLCLLFVVILIGIVYVFLTITPSHYGVILKEHFGLDYQPLLGQAHPIRGDEYSVTTPYFQIAVNNDFQRYNQTSPYGEDLRSFVGLPLQDWALVFKPYMWGFWVLDAARAFSLYHYFMIAAFLVGFTLFLNRLNLPLLYSAITAVILFFSHHNQVWWSSNAPVLALTVWIILPFLFKWSYPIKFLATFYISIMAILALIYPAWQISQVYVFVVLALVFRRDSFRIGNVAICALGFLVACGLSYYYLQDIIPLMQNTVYPGTNTYSGGSSGKYFLWAQLAPHSLIQNNFNPIFLTPGINVSEVGTVSSLLLTFLLSFTNYSWAVQKLKTNIWKYIISIVCLGVVLAWMFLAIPSHIGRFLLLDHIGPHRFVLALGTYLVILSSITVFYSQWIFSWLRLVIYCSITAIIPTIIYFRQHDTFDFINSFDKYDLLAVVITLIVLGIKFLPKKYLTHTQKLAYGFAFTALIYNVISFSHFNPLQEASDIFSKELKTKVEVLKSELNLSPDVPVAYEGPKAISAALNGLGLPTLNHAFLVPQLEYFQKKFPELSSQENNFLFNRFAKVGTVDSFREPILVAKDVVGIPGKSAAAPIKISLDSAVDIEIAKQVFVNNFQWSEITDEEKLLKVDFYSPTILDVNSSEVVVQFNEIIQGEIEKKRISVTSSFIAKPDLTKFFVVDGATVEANTIWQLFLTFVSQDVEKLSDLEHDLEKGLKSIYFRDVQSEYLLYPTKNLDVEVISKDFFLANDVVATSQGNVDNVYYNPESKTLRVTGWTPVEDMLSARWFGYTDSSNAFKLQSVKSKIRNDVPLNQGINPNKGFELVFEATNFDESSALPLCLYSRKDTLGIFPINAKGHNTFCSGDGYIEHLAMTFSTQSKRGNIDVINYDETNSSLTIKGWAPPEQTLGEGNPYRWFGYSSDLRIKKSSLVNVLRPDVVNVFGDAYAMSGFELQLELDSNFKPDFPLDLCLYSSNNEFGDFMISSANESPILHCQK